MQTVIETTDWETSLLALLERQHELADDLDALAQRQAEHIANSNTDALLRLLADRQTIIEQFTRAQGELTALTGDIETRLRTLPEEKAQRIQHLIADIGQRLSGVMQRDAEDQRTLEKARSAKRDELTALDQSRQARVAYMNRADVGSRFSDRKG
jgi:hypothetical protein